MNICICGGGNLGHVIAGFVAAKKDYDVSLLTRRPEQWNKTLCIYAPDGKIIEGTLQQIISNAADVIPQADIVLLCLPGYGIVDTLQTILPYLKPQTPVGSVVSSTGFFFEAMKILPETTPLFGFQRVPFIARVEDYGKSAHLLGYKPSLSMAVERGDSAVLARIIEEMLDTPVQLLAN